MIRMKLESVIPENRHLYDRMVQYYECEFSSLTHKKPDSEAVFSLDTELGGNVLGFVSLIDGIPSGLAAVKDHGNLRFEICEFFVVPCFRRQMVGSSMAKAIWEKLPGFWEVKQIQGAEDAISFWRRLISVYTRGNYEEDSFIDPFWGKVTRQRFQCFSGISGGSDTIN